MGNQKLQFEEEQTIQAMVDNIVHRRLQIESFDV